jgi:hypothetical protein
MSNEKIIVGMTKILGPVDSEEANLYKVASALIKCNISLSKQVDNFQQQIKLFNTKMDLIRMENKSDPFGGMFGGYKK